MFKNQAKNKNSNRLLDDDIEKDIVIPEYEYDENNDDNDDVPEEEYDNDVMEETVIEREEGTDLRYNKIRYFRLRFKETLSRDPRETWDKPKRDMSQKYEDCEL